MMTCTRALALPTLLSVTFGCSTTFNLTFTAGGETDSATTAPEPECGNGVLQADEECDDGNVVDGDGCTAACVVQVCGDGLVQDGEACDDGNPDDADCCTNACTHGQVETGQVCWTLSLDAHEQGDSANAVAVDKTGRIIVVGQRSDAMGDADQLILVLDPGGKEVWRKTYAGDAGLFDSLYGVAVDDEGQIFAAGREWLTPLHWAAVLRSVTPDGESTWSFVEPNPIPYPASIKAVTIAGDGAIYSVGWEDSLDGGTELVLRRHDPADGAPLWRSSTNAGTFDAYGTGVAVSGSSIVAVGAAGDGDGPTSPLIAVYDPMGNEVSLDVEEHPSGIWLDVRPIGEAGDLLLAGRRLNNGTGADLAFRRIEVTGAVKWTQTYDLDNLVDPDLREDTALGAAVGPEEALVIAGEVVMADPDPIANAFTRLCTGDGAEVWTSVYDNPERYATAYAAAFGPGFVVTVGYESVLGQSGNLWIRNYKHK